MSVKEDGRAEVLVVGGGPAGFAAALAAGRAGADTLLIERSGRLGGMATLGLVSPLLGCVNSKFVDEILGRLGGREVDHTKLDLDYAQMLAEAGVRTLLHTCAVEPIMSGQTVGGCVAYTKSGHINIESAATIDATGDGDVAYLAGVPFEQGRPGDGLMQPASIMFRVGGVGPSPLLCGSEGEVTCAAKNVHVVHHAAADIL